MFPLLGAIAGGILDIFQSEEQADQNAYQAQQSNAFNAEQAAAAMRFNAEQADIGRTFSAQQAAINRDFASAEVNRQMSFQEQMANTSHQRAVQDLTRAGLNPMLAIRQGGAPAPGGGAASGQSASAGNASGSGASSVQPPRAPDLIGAFSRAMNTGYMAQRIEAEVENMEVNNANLRKQGDRIEAETELLKAQVPKVQQDTLTSRSSAAMMDQRITHMSADISRMNYEVDRLIEQRRNIRADSDLKEFDLRQLRPAIVKLTQLQAQLAALEVPRASNLADAQGSWWMRNVSPYLPDLGGVTRGIESLGRGGNSILDLRMRRR